MNYRPDIFEPRNKSIVKVRKIGVALVLGFITLGMVRSEFERLATQPHDPLLIAYLCLFLVIAVFIYGWIYTTEMELDQLFHWLHPKGYASFPSSLKESMMIFVLAVLFVGFVYSSGDPLYFGILFTSYSVVIPFCTRHVNNELADVFERSRQHIRDEISEKGNDEKWSLFLQGIDALESYFLHRRHTRRHIIIVPCAVLGTAVAGISNAIHSSALVLLSYFIFIVTIIWSEIVVFRWRSIRDQALRRIDSSLADLNDR